MQKVKHVKMWSPNRIYSNDPFFFQNMHDIEYEILMSILFLRFQYFSLFNCEVC